MPWVANNNQPGQYRAPTSIGLVQEEENTINKITIPLLVGTLNGAHFPLNGPPCGYVNPVDLPEEVLETLNHSPCFVYPRTHPQFLLSLRISDQVPSKSILMREISIVNLEVCLGALEEWTVYKKQDVTLKNLSLEIRPRVQPEIKLELSTKPIIKMLRGILWRHLITELERITFHLDGIEYFCRVLETEGEDLEEDEYVISSIFRGYVDADTEIFLTIDDSLYNGWFHLLDVVPKPIHALGPCKDVVYVTTNDEEMFPVKKKLLQPCIRLTSAVLAGSGIHKEASNHIHVDVDCLTFDRVLLYLEHEVKGIGESFSFDPEHNETLLKAAISLGCHGLEMVCKSKAGEFESRVRKHAISWNEVLIKNASNEIWLVMDGMIFDVTRWLPEHPGGSVIIPREALNVDCTVMFEIYHSSRQSFRYLKQFYIGELAEHDRSKVPIPSNSPSEAFMEELRQYSTWRTKPEEKVFKSF